MSGNTSSTEELFWSGTEYDVTKTFSERTGMKRLFVAYGIQSRKDFIGVFGKIRITN